MSKPRLPHAIGILVLLALGILVFPRGGGGEDSATSPAPRERRANPATQPAADSPRQRPDSQAANRQREPLVAHQVEDLPQFILPLVEGHEVSLKKAVNVLMNID